MKYKMIGIVSMICLLISGVVLTSAKSDNPNNRIHQHLTAQVTSEDCEGEEEFCTHLPLVIIDTDGKEIPGEPITNEFNEEIGYTTTADNESMLSAKISIISDETKTHHLTDEPDLESKILIRVRGHSSRFYDKKGYLVRLIDDSGNYRNEEVMGMDAHYEWAMHGPYLDKSLIRNYMWYNIAGEIMDYAPNVRFCEVVLNGEYIGLYVMTETITNGEDCRVNISKPVAGLNQTGYVLRLDRGSNNSMKNLDTFTHYSLRNLQEIDIQYPRSGDLTPELINAIEQDFSNFEKSLYSFDYDTDNYGYFYDIHVSSFVDYFIINEFTTNYDAGWLSTYVYKDIGGKYNLVVWDFNSSCDNYAFSTIDPMHFEIQHNIWYYMLTKDEDFVDKIIDRYRELRETYLSEEYLYNYIDETVAYLGDAIDRNFEIWGYSFEEFTPLEPIERNPKNFEEAVQQIKDFIHVRGVWMDENIEVLRQYSHESKNKKFNH